MKEHSPNFSKIIVFLIILLIGCQAQNSSCSRQRCCLLSTCTSLYCIQKSSQTWISTQNYDNYQYTKLVLSNNECKPCSYNCKICSTQSLCTQCYDGFYLNVTNNNCSPCDYKCLKCQVINSLSKCSECDLGSYLDTTTLGCKLCPMGAKSCVDQTSIVECNPGYLKSSNSLFCTPCPSYCISCPTSTSTCSVCDTGYYVSSGTCRKCNITNCDTCVGVGASIFCTQCSSGFFRQSSTVCSSCPLNCKTCSNSTICTTCKTGYYIQGGGCSTVLNLISNCQTYSNTTVNGTNKCSACISGYYLSSTGLQCIPCSITCNSCYGDHFGRCTSCINTTKLFNQMCLPVPYITSTQLQLYYTAAANYNILVGGSLTCSSLLYSGSTIALELNNLASYKLLVKFRLFTDIPSQQYNISLNSTTNSTSLSSTNNTYNSSSFTSSSQGYKLCTSSNNSASYYAHIQTTTFSSVKLQNKLTFTSVSSSLKLYISEILITAYKCSSLCLQCSESQCFICMTQNLYKQDAYCVYVCGNGYYTYEKEKQCVKQCPLGTYSLLTNISCVACVSPCMTCLNDRYCLSCVQGYFLSTLTHTCQTACPYRYYGSLKTQKCQQCVGRCNQCINDQECLTCQTGFLQNTTCVDNCPAGFYQNITTLKCQLCSTQCLTCQYNINNCLSCPLGKYFYNNTCVLSCPLGYYINYNSSSCQTCLYPCENCINSSSLCLSCVDGYLLNYICYPQCPNKYYANNVLLICQSCNPVCTKCTSSATNCIECISGYKLFSNQCLQNCPDKYYPELLPNTSITICSKCVGVCYTCLNQTFCLSCSSNFLTSNNSGQCVRPTLCMSYQYGNINTLKCQPCSSSCFTCYYNASFCTSCFTGAILFNNSCLGSCPNNYFYALSKIVNSYTQSSCTVCQQPCLTCINQTSCLSCIQGYKYSSNTHICSSTCSIGSYFNTSINDCQACSTDCLNCNNNQFCNICKLGTYLYVIASTSNQCVSSCPSGFYADGLSCMACLYPCLLCTSSIDCVNCQNGVLYQSRCISGCPQSTYMNIPNNTCQNCQGNCLTCKGSPTLCTSCKSGFYIIVSNYTCVSACPNATYPFNISKSCLNCPQTCSTCLNNSYCTACIINKTYLNPATHSCIEYCAAGYFGNIVTGICEPCQAKCQTCTKTASECLTCSNNYLLIRLQNATYDCVSQCPSRYFNESNICYRCIFPCKQCLSASICKTCAIGTYYHNQSKSCLLSCPLGTYYVTTPNLQCKTCSSPCKTCKDSTKCISCISNHTLYQGTCVTECPPKFYADGSGICNKCNGYCQTCSGKYYCLTCLTGFAYSGICQSTCPPGTYASLEQKKCLQCSPPCLECVSIATYCKKCQPGLFVYRGQCSSDCPVGTHKNGQICQTCKFPCIKCENQFHCSQCIGGYLLYMNASCIVNSEKCPNDLYKLNFKQCVPSTWCPSTYYRDEQLKTCSNACSPQKYFNRMSLTCINHCNQGEYVSRNMQCTNWTSQLPTSLMGMETIVFIKSSEVNVVIVFNETVQWLVKGENLYSVRGLEIGRRLLLQNYNSINYTLLSPQQLVFQIKQMPYSVQVNLPAHYLRSSITGYNLQTPNITVRLPTYISYGYEQVYIGSLMKQFSEGISWFIILFSLFFLFMNRLSDVYILWDTAQLLFLLVFLNIQYPPNLNQFLVGMSNVNFLFVPSLFASIVPDRRLVSSGPFYAYTYDNNFLRTAGSPLLLALIVFVVFLVLKIIELLIKHSEKVKQKMDQYPRIKNYILKGLLRFRWHHTSDVFFLSYDIVMLFAVAQIKNISNNPNNIISNVVCGIVFLIYIIFPCFVSYKLYKHYNNIAKGKMVTNLQCFYRGIEKTNKFGISLILIRYFRKLTYCIIIGIFTNQPMFALPILMFTSVLLALFIFINKPFKKRLSNVINVMTQACLVVIYLFIALIQFGIDSLSLSAKVILGWVSCGLLLVVLFALIFQIFCKSMFYLQSQKVGKQGDKAGDNNKNTQQNELTKKFTQEYIRKKAGQFFDQYFPKLKSNFNMDDSSQMLNQYEEGDSQNSQNNEQRQKQWGIYSESQSKRSDQFRHYGQESQQGTNPKSFQYKNSDKKAPSYLIRCVKELH